MNCIYLLNVIYKLRQKIIQISDRYTCNIYLPIKSMIKTISYIYADKWNIYVYRHLNSNVLIVYVINKQIAIYFTSICLKHRMSNEILLPLSQKTKSISECIQVKYALITNTPVFSISVWLMEHFFFAIHQYTVIGYCQ